jgi:membrane protein
MRIVNNFLKSIKNYRGITYFTIKEIFDGCHRHNYIALNSSIAFFTLLTIVPLFLLIFFFLSQWLANSSFALSELESITAHLLPQINQKLMNEIVNVSTSRISWGIILIFILFLAATPLTASLRSSFIRILGLRRKNTFFKNKIRDIFAVITIITLFFAYIFINIYLTKITIFFNAYIPIIEINFITSLLSLLLMVIVVASFFQFFMPLKIKKLHLIIGGLLTTFCWYGLSNIFDLVISMSSSYGLFYGGLRNLFISLIWLYLNISALLIGAETIAALHKQDILLIKQLFFIKNIHRHPIINDLMKRYGYKYKKNKVIYTKDEQDFKLYFIIEGEVSISQENKTIKIISAGEYFGEQSLLSKIPRKTTAIVSSDWSRIIIASESQIKKILIEDSQIALKFLSHMARL